MTTGFPPWKHGRRRPSPRGEEAGQRPVTRCSVGLGHPGLDTASASQPEWERRCHLLPPSRTHHHRLSKSRSAPPSLSKATCSAASALGIGASLSCRCHWAHLALSNPGHQPAHLTVGFTTFPPPTNQNHQLGLCATSGHEPVPLRALWSAASLWDPPRPLWCEGSKVPASSPSL